MHGDHPAGTLPPYMQSKSSHRHHTVESNGSPPFARWQINRPPIGRKVKQPGCARENYDRIAASVRTTVSCFVLPFAPHKPLDPQIRWRCKVLSWFSPLGVGKTHICYQQLRERSVPCCAAQRKGCCFTCPAIFGSPALHLEHAKIPRNQLLDHRGVVSASWNGLLHMPYPVTQLRGKTQIKPLKPNIHTSLGRRWAPLDRLQRNRISSGGMVHVQQGMRPQINNQHANIRAASV